MRKSARVSTAGAAGKRLPKANRREQLLKTAQRIAREEGTDALTLGYLAERAGVSKPIAYEHFGSRAGLLIALYKEIDDKQVAALQQALQNTRRRLEDVARVMSEAYMHCYALLGAEWLGISAALKGNEEMETFQQELIESYVDIYRQALAPYSSVSAARLRALCVGIIGAAEALAREMTQGRIEESAATDALATLMVKAISGK
jgi:AcrR family transcriptional regulator